MYRAVVATSMAVLLLEGGLVAPAASAVPQTANAATYVSVQPTRVMDTNSGLGAPAPPARGTSRLPMLGHAGIPANGVTAVVLTVTVIAPSTAGYLTVWADNAQRPTTANVNFSAGRSQADEVYAPVGANGRIDFYNGSSGDVRLLADVSGYFSSTTAAPAGAFVSTNPTRVVDTRSSRGAGPVAARGTAAVHLLGVGTVPTAGVSAVVFTVTALSPGAGGYITAYAGGTARPATSNLDFAAHESIGNLVVARVGHDGTVDLYNGSAGSVQFVVDVQGYFISGPPRVTGAYVPLTPTRVLAQSPTAARTVTNAAGEGLPEPDPIPTKAAGASVVNVTATGVTASGYLLVYGAGARTNVSTASVTRGLVTAGSAVVAGDARGGKIYNGTLGSLRLTNDLFGYYLDAPGLGSISGRVTDATASTGIRGVQVIAYYESDVEPGDVAYAEYTRTATAADGSYVLPQLYAGTPYKVCFDAVQASQPDPSIGFVSACYDGVPWDSPGSGFFNTLAQDVAVSSDSPTTINAQLTRTAAGRVTGHTTLADGAALAGVQIDFHRSGGDATANSRVVTDGSGAYSAVLASGTYTVCFNTGYLPAGSTPYGYAQVCPDAPVRITTGGVVESSQVIPQNEAVVGRVLTSTGALVHGGQVALFNSDRDVIYTEPLTTSGSYTLPSIAPGNYFVCFSSDPSANPPYGLVDECNQNVPWNANEHPPSGASPVAVVDGAYTTVNATLPYAGAISGTVTTSSGAAVNNVFVQALDPTTSVQITRGFTDATGHYTLLGLPPSSTGYALCFNPAQASPTGESPQCYSGIPWDGSRVPNGTTAVTVTARADHDHVNAVLSP